MSQSQGRNPSGPADPWNPEALEGVQGPTYAGDYSWMEEDVEEMLEQTSRRTGVDLDAFDDINIDDSLPRNVPAATSHRGYEVPFLGDIYGQTDLHVNPDMLDLPDYEQRHVLTHEGIHGLQFNGELLDEVGDKIPEEVMDELYHRLAYGTEEELEGATELLARYINPESSQVGEKFRRDEARKVGEEIDSELVDDIEDLKNDLLDEYREVYNVEAGESFYMEAGNFAGEEYIAVIEGDYAPAEGEDVVMDYLEGVSTYPNNLDKSSYDPGSSIYEEGDDYEPVDEMGPDFDIPDFGEIP